MKTISFIARVCALLCAAPFAVAANSGLFEPYENFTPPTMRTSSVSAMAVGDVNHDGRPDMLLAGSEDPNFIQSSLFVYYQQPDGSQSLTSYPFAPAQGWDVSGIAVGDVNGDGLNDVVSGHAGGKLEVFLQTTSGTLAAPVVYANNGISVSAPVIADMNGDGRKDVVAMVSYWSGNPTFAIFYQQADGTLSRTDLSNVLDLFFYTNLKVGDLNGDGRPDIAILRTTGGEFDGTPNVLVYPQLADGSFGEPSTYITVLDGVVDSSQRGSADSMDLGDVNADGRLDVVVGNYTWNGGYYLAVLTQDGSGGMNPLVQVPDVEITQARELKVGDVNGDGRNDVVINDVSRRHIGLYLQTAAGALAPMEDYPTPDSSNGARTPGIEFADIDGDGDTDIVLLDFSFGLTVLRGSPAFVDFVDLQVFNNRSLASVGKGNNVDFTWTVRNDGTLDAYDVVMTGAVPAYATFVSAPDCTLSAGTVSCPVGHMLAGDASSFVITLKASAVGTMTLTANAQTSSDDINAANNSASASVSVLAPNKPPIANAGPDRTVKAGRNVVLDGSKSRDPEGGPLIVNWHQVSGVGVAIRNPESLVASFTAPAVPRNKCYELVFELVVTDDRGTRASDRVKFSVVN